MHAIMEHDKGFVLGTTWHKHPAYVTSDIPISIDQAMEVMDFPLEVRQSFRSVNHADVPKMVPIEGAFHVVRSDFDVVLAPYVGRRYRVLSNQALIEHVSSNVMNENPDLAIESTGTLFNGKVSFVNLVVKKWVVEGDDSPLEHRMMYYNPIGLGAYRICCHTTRVVCNNTLQAAAAEGEANKTMHKVSHTKTADVRINASMTDLSKVYLGLETFEEQIRKLAMTKMTMKQAESFFKHVFKLDLPTTTVSMKRAQKRYDEVMHILSSDGTIDNKTAWGVLNAYTNVIDHAVPRASQDASAITWDALVGDRSRAKSAVMKQLVNTIQK